MHRSFRNTAEQHGARLAKHDPYGFPNTHDLDGERGGKGKIKEQFHLESTVAKLETIRVTRNI